MNPQVTNAEGIMLESHHFATSTELMDPENKRNGFQNLQVKGQ